MAHVDMVELARKGAMETICFEMATYVSRTATTPILNQSNERNATILDARGRLAALSVGIPQFMLTSTLPVRFGPGAEVQGPALVEEPFTVVVVPPDARARIDDTGNYQLTL